MNPDIFQLKELILLFRNELTQRVLWEQGSSPIVSEKDTLQPWEKTEAYSWIFFETNYLFFWGSSDKTNRQQCSFPYPDCLLLEAETYYSKWGMREKRGRGHAVLIPKIKEIYKYKEYGIPKPTAQESLIAYIERLRSLVCKQTYSKKIWEESLASFLEFVRVTLPPEYLGFIDVIFPEDKAFYSNTIVRLIRKEKFPTNIIFAAQILKNLSEELLWADARRQFTAAEALAFSWLCLTSARLQLPTTIKLLRSFDPLSLIKEKCPERAAFPKRYILKIPTLFGHVSAEISKLLFDYLNIMAKNYQPDKPSGSFFKSSQRSLERTFDKAVNKLSLQPKDGEITFTTLTSWPNEVMHHRTQIDNSKYSASPSLS